MAWRIPRLANVDYEFGAIRNPQQHSVMLRGMGVERFSFIDI